jgi:CRP-like cAMP-binding protein
MGLLLFGQSRKIGGVFLKEIPMNEQRQSLAKVPLFASLTADELTVVDELVQPVEWRAGEEIYSAGDDGGSMFAVQEGVVELYGMVGGIEKLFMTVRAGGVFGLLTMIDEGNRPGNARAVENTRALILGRQGLDTLLETKPEIGIKVLEGVGRVLGERVRTLTEQYEATLAWNLEVTGLTSLNLERIMTDRIEVVLETVRGEPLRGTLLRFEASAAGYEFYLETEDKQIHLIPYHAVARISVDRSTAPETADSPNF